MAARSSLGWRLQHPQRDHRTADRDGELLADSNLDSYTLDFYTAHHAQIATALAERVTQALHNARLYTAERERAVAAEALAQTRNDFVAAVSHELRTPLTAIVGYAELLQARWTQMDDGSGSIASNGS